MLKALSSIVPEESIEFEIGKMCEAYVTKIFAGKVRDTNDAYVEHLRRVAIHKIVSMHKRNEIDFNLFLIALMHDLFEDFRCKGYLIKVWIIFGFDVAFGIWWLTKPSKKLFFGNKRARDHFFYLKLWLAPRRYFSIKMCDRHDNLDDMWIEHHSREFQEKKISETVSVYIPIAKKNSINYDTLLQTVERARIKLDSYSKTVLK